MVREKLAQLIRSRRESQRLLTELEARTDAVVDGIASSERTFETIRDKMPAVLDPALVAQEDAAAVAIHAAKELEKKSRHTLAALAGDIETADKLIDHLALAVIQEATADHPPVNLAVWRAALFALRTDAYAPLPTRR
jgi:fumarate hydratase class II